MRKMHNVDEEYKRIISNILENGREKIDRTKTGTLSVFSDTFTYNMENGFPLLTTKEMFTKGIITELLWFLNGDTNIKSLLINNNNIWLGDAYKAYAYKFKPSTKQLTPYTKVEFKHEIMNNDEFAKIWGDLGPIYGRQWVNISDNDDVKIVGWEHGAPTKFEKETINQIQNSIDLLKNDPDSRRNIVDSWNVKELKNMTLPPCHFAFQFYTETLTESERVELIMDTGMDALTPISRRKFMDNNNIPTRRLCLKWNQRSVDSGLGLPFNIASYAMLLVMVAQQVNMVPGMLVGDLTNVHIYNDHIEQIKEQLSRDARKPPRLLLNKAKDIFSYNLEDFKIVDYDPHDKLEMNLSN